MASERSDPGEPAGAAIPALRRVLVTTDLSDLGDRAIPFAYTLAGDGGAVVLLHVVEPPSAPNPLYAHYTPGETPTPQQRAAQEEELRGRLRALVPRDARARGIATEVELAEGLDVPDCICEVAEHLRVDAICIASHGRRGIVRTLLGSVTEAVLRRSHRPVLIVPPPRS